MMASANICSSLLKDLLEDVVFILRLKGQQIGVEFSEIEKHLACFVMDLCNVSSTKSSKHMTCMVIDMCHMLKKMQGKKQENLSSSPDASMTLDELLLVLEATFDAALAVIGSLAGFTEAQVKKADQDMDVLINTIKDLEHGDIEAQAGAEQLVRNLMQLLVDLGVNTYIPPSDKPTELDAVLEVLRGVLDSALEVYGPRFNLTSYTISLLEADLAGIEATIRDIEHGRVPLTEGLVAVVDGVFNMLRDFGVPVLETDADASLAEKTRGLQTQLVTVRGVIESYRETPLPPSAPSLDAVAKLCSDIVGLDGSKDSVSLFEVVHDMNEVAREFVRVMG